PRGFEPEQVIDPRLELADQRVERVEIARVRGAVAGRVVDLVSFARLRHRVDHRDQLPALQRVEETRHGPQLGLGRIELADGRIGGKPPADLAADPLEPVAVGAVGFEFAYQCHRRARYHLVMMYLTPRTTGIPAWSVHGLGTPCSSALFQISSAPGRGSILRPRLGKSVVPPSSTSLRNAIAVNERCPPRIFSCFQ